MYVRLPFLLSCQMLLIMNAACVPVSGGQNVCRSFYDVLTQQSKLKK